MTAGYAVIDLETTGIHPGWNERVVEVGVVHVAPNGTVEGQWETLINPNRDLGPQRVHGISAAEVRNAPAFEHIAGELAELLGGRALVAHNLWFDARFLVAEYARLRVDVPVSDTHGLCTMALAHHYLPGGGRSLADCCEAFDIDNPQEHRALTDAMVTAELLSRYLAADPYGDHWRAAVARAARVAWPAVPRSGGQWCRRGANGEQRHFLGRLVDKLPSVDGYADVEPYLAMLDRSLVHRAISIHEADELVALADELGIDRQRAHELHEHYVAQLAYTAWQDGVITDAERADLHTVGSILGMDLDHIDAIIGEEPPAAESVPDREAFALQTRNLITFTGEMNQPREGWESAAEAAGLQPHPAVTKKVRLLVAADPDSASGKARKARQYEIPIVNEATFGQLLNDVEAAGVQ